MKAGSIQCHRCLALQDAEGFRVIHRDRVRGYTGVALWQDRTWVIYAGCHKFSVTDALAHWADCAEYIEAIKAAPGVVEGEV